MYTSIKIALANKASVLVDSQALQLDIGINNPLLNLQTLSDLYSLSIKIITDHNGV